MSLFDRICRAETVDEIRDLVREYFTTPQNYSLDERRNLTALLLKRWLDIENRAIVDKYLEEV